MRHNYSMTMAIVFVISLCAATAAAQQKTKAHQKWEY
jgi:hypothetical protein